MHAIDEMHKQYYELFKRKSLLGQINVYCYSEYNGRGWFITNDPQWSNYKHYRLVPKYGPNKDIWDQFLKDPSKVLFTFNNNNWFSLTDPDPTEAPSFFNPLVLYKIGVIKDTNTELSSEPKPDE